MKRKMIVFLVLMSCAALALSCATALTTEGAAVKVIMKEEAPNNCTQIGDVKTGYGGELDMTSFKNHLRNETAKLGGNLVVVDTVELMIVGQGNKQYHGSGRAYLCK